MGHSGIIELRGNQGVVEEGSRKTHDWSRKALCVGV